MRDGRGGKAARQKYPGSVELPFVAISRTPVRPSHPPGMRRQSLAGGGNPEGRGAIPDVKFKGLRPVRLLPWPEVCFFIGPQVHPTMPYSFNLNRFV
jgi:hypothetical protein